MKTVWILIKQASMLLMNYLLLVFSLLFFTNCKHGSGPNKKAARTQPSLSAAKNINYDSCKNAIAVLKKQKRSTWATLPKSEKEKILTNAIAKTIVPAWIGTAWDFNGTTQTPQKGSIACGYFVTTVLQDAGFAIARTKLAQCASEQMITTLVQPKYVQRFSNISIEKFIAAIPASNIGLYIVGLDNHTGFIYNDGQDIFFIHSTFAGTRNVQKEMAVTSWVLQQSKYKVLASLSADEKILEKWIR